MEVVAALLCQGPWVLCLRRAPGSAMPVPGSFPEARWSRGNAGGSSGPGALEELELRIEAPAFLGTVQGHRDGGSPSPFTATPSSCPGRSRAPRS